MQRSKLFVALSCVALSLIAASVVAVSLRTTGQNVARGLDDLAAPQPSIAHGKYLVQVGGCNDCHTAGYTQLEGKVPVAQWLTGNRLGWRGPWGTTYPTNLRLHLASFSEEQWLAHARIMRPRPPMPWFNLSAMSDADLRSIHRFVVSLGPAGTHAPDYVPLDAEPSAPFVRFP